MVERSVVLTTVLLALLVAFECWWWNFALKPYPEQGSPTAPKSALYSETFDPR